jgi:hypothetical protein
MLIKDEGAKSINFYGSIWIMLTIIVRIAVVGFINYEIDIPTLAIKLKGRKKNHYLNAHYSLKKIARAAFKRIKKFILNALLLMRLIESIQLKNEVEFKWIFVYYSNTFTIFVITIGLNDLQSEWL